MLVDVISDLQMINLDIEDLKSKKEFIVKDNLNSGEWDWDILANEWSNEQLNEWGLDVMAFNEDFGEESLSDDNIPEELDQVIITFSMPNYTYEKADDQIQQLIKKYLFWIALLIT